YPQGTLAMYDALRKFNNQENIDSLLKYYSTFSREFTINGKRYENSRIKDRMGSRIALIYSQKGNYNAYLKMVSEVESPIEKASDYINVATSLLGSEKELTFADS